MVRRRAAVLRSGFFLPAAESDDFGSRAPVLLSRPPGRFAMRSGGRVGCVGAREPKWSRYLTLHSGTDVCGQTTHIKP